MNNTGKIAHALKHSHRRHVIGAFDKKLHKGSIWNRHRSVLSLILQKSTFIHFINHATKFYDGYINYDDRKNIGDDGSVVKPKKKFGNISDSKY